MFKNVTLINILLIVTLISFVNCASLSLTEQKKYKQLIEGQGLYTRDDDIEIFTASNFKTLYGQDRGVLVEFYNSWCGFCQRFAPSWKALGTDLRGWKNIVSIGAIDCSDEDNSPICREFEIMGYPTLRYFHENYSEGPKQIGADVPKGEDLDKLRFHLVQRLITEQAEGRGKKWPVLTSYSGENIDNIFNDVNEKVKYIFVIAEEKNNLAAEAALDLQKIPDIAVRSVIKNNTQFVTSHHINTFPFLIVATREKSIEPIRTESHSREHLVQAIKEYLKTKGIKTPEEEKKEKFRGKWIENQVPDLAALLEARERQALLQRVQKMGDVVFQVDLETALRSALKHEVATTKVIEGEKMIALRNFLDVIIKYFPTGRKGKTFLEDLRKKLVVDSINGKDIEDYLKPMDNEEEAIFSSPQQWLGCSGSSSKFRGYPCGMWKMFHYLTVNAADQNAGKENVNPREILDAMFGYIKNYFGCADCSKHFQEMALKNDMKGVEDLNSSIIWLWVAHNQVNKRLAGDSTEDPEHPKIQFPSRLNCPKCYDEDKWNFQEVLQYLRHMYSSINVRYLGADTKVLHDGLGSTRSKRSSGTWEVINRMDVSMCFILYVVCFGLLVLIVRQFLKKGYKKKMYVHDLLGKV